VSRKLSTTEAARILGMRDSHIRELVRSGLGRPERRGRRYAFSFQDLVVLRTAHDLIGQEVPAARVARSLAALVSRLPEGRPLSGLRIFAEGGRVVVQEGELCFDPETGQTVLDFEAPPEAAVDVAELERRTETVVALSEASDDSTGAQARIEFERALELEDEDPMAACTCYGRAIELDPELVDAYVNLGRIAHEAGRGVEAIRLYRLALVRTPDDPVLHFNLALAIDDTAGAAAAAPHYERALALAPDFADAHYNLAGVCEKLDRPRDALRHYREYKRLTSEA
jgi:tetratricopeptide (TPR) repeat protein